MRRRKGAEIWLEVHGLCAGLQADPMEKKPLFHFLPGTRVLSLGTPGCNLRCSFCQNWKLSQSAPEKVDLEETSPLDIAENALLTGCKSVAFTYNEPIVFAEYAMEAAAACRDLGLRTVAVSAGYISHQARGDFFSSMDAVNIDLKAFSTEFYRQHCGAKLEHVLETLCYLHDETSLWLEVTTLLIPGLNDSKEEIDRASDWFAMHLGKDVPWHFTAFHPSHRLKHLPRTPAETLQSARELARSKGLHYVYTGNVEDSAGATTCCPRCGAELIEREGFRVIANRLEAGACPSCGAPVSGCFH